MTIRNDAAAKNDTNPPDEETGWAKLAKVMMLVAGVVILFFVVLTVRDLFYAPFPVGTTSQQAWQVRGTMGDFYGGHLAAGAGLAAFLLMFGALLLQREELRFQRADLRLNFQEYKRSVDEAVRQTKAIKAQAEAIVSQNAIAAEQVSADQDRNDTDYVVSVVRDAIDMYRCAETAEMTRSMDLKALENYKRRLRIACEHKIRICVDYIVRRERIRERKLEELREILYTVHDMMGLDLGDIFARAEAGRDGPA